MSSNIFLRQVAETAAYLEGRLEAGAGWRVRQCHARLLPEEQEAALRFGPAAGAGGGGCVVVCTDVLARGLDLEREVDAVVQLAPPRDAAVYLHRIGPPRAARFVPPSTAGEG